MRITPPPVSVSRGLRGQGVFSKKPLRLDQEIAQITGQIIDDPNYTSSYCIDLGGNLSLEPASPFRFLNHSCKPNCEIIRYDAEDSDTVPEAWLIAVRQIRPKEELTIDYAWPAADAIPCLCGAKTCRGWIVDVQELHRVRRRATPPGRQNGTTRRPTTQSLQRT